MEKEVAAKYESLHKEHGKKFLDWLQDKWLTTHSVFKFTASPKYALDLMKQFEEKQCASGTDT